MKKVIALLADKSQIITTRATAEKNNYPVTYEVEVIAESAKKPESGAENQVPKVGTVLYGIGGRAYTISKLDPEYICAQCGAKNAKSRIGNEFFCTRDFNRLVVTDPLKYATPKPQRNALCSCNSGKKYKHCCGNKQHTARHYFNSEYKRQEQDRKSA